MQQLRRGCGLQTERIHSFCTSSQLSVGQSAILNSQVRLKIGLPWGWGETNGYSLIFNKQPPFLGGRLRYVQYNLALLSQVRVARSYTGSRRKIEKEGNFSIISRGNSCCYWPEESFADTHNFLGIPHQLDLAERSIHLWHGVALPPHRHLHCILQGGWQQPAKIDRIWVFSEHPDGPPDFIPISILPILFFFFFSFKYAWCFKARSKAFCLFRSRIRLCLTPKSALLLLFVVVPTQPFLQSSSDEGAIATPGVFLPPMKDAGWSDTSTWNALLKLVDTAGTSVQFLFCTSQL